jgi:hypothetical protein
VKFVIPTNPGPYPATVDTDKVTGERQLAEHKADFNEYETYLGVENYLRRMLSSRSTTNGLPRLKVRQLDSITGPQKHYSPTFRSVGGTLDHMDVTELFTNIQKPWDGIEAPAAEHSLTH